MKLRSWLVCFCLSAVLFGSQARAEQLRIAPEDLRIRSAVSRLLSPSLRLSLRDLAAATPLPLSGGVLQTDQVLDKRFMDRGWDEDHKALVRYYFLVARMEKSRDFSEEFARRRAVTESGRSLMRTYVQDLNKAIAQAIFVPDVAVDLGPQREFPLLSVGWKPSPESEQARLEVLHSYPKVNTKLGRETLRQLREVAGTDIFSLESQLSALDDAERLFLEEVHLVGRELVLARPRMTELVRLPRAGLPFSF